MYKKRTVKRVPLKKKESLLSRVFTTIFSRVANIVEKIKITFKR